MLLREESSRNCFSMMSCFGMGDFKKLRVWRDGHKMTLATIRACEHVNGSIGTLVRNQLIRAVMSVPANIAEGSAKRSDREFARFVRIALGSATEAENHLILVSDLELFEERTFKSLAKQLEDVQKMLAGLEKRLTTDAAESKPPRVQRAASSTREMRVAKSE